MDLSKCHERWFAVQVRPRHEFVAAQLLRRKGYEEFLPRYRCLRRWSDRIKKVEEPLFRGYVFCRFDAQIRSPLIATPGVIGIVGSRNGPTPIPEQEIESIRRLVMLGLDLQPCSYTSIGDRLQINNGPLAGIEGVVIEIRNRRQLILSIDLVRASVIVDIHQCSPTSGTSLTVA